eukprot:9501303-Pyramimonas_sp.AAC.2
MGVTFLAVFMGVTFLAVFMGVCLTFMAVFMGVTFVAVFMGVTEAVFMGVTFVAVLLAFMTFLCLGGLTGSSRSTCLTPPVPSSSEPDAISRTPATLLKALGRSTSSALGSGLLPRLATAVAVGALLGVLGAPLLPNPRPSDD